MAGRSSNSSKNSGNSNTGGNKPSTRRVIDARQDEQGNISHVLLEGNQNFTPLSTAISMAERGDLANVHVVQQQDGGRYLRTNPDGRTTNNLDDMAADS